jgi:hypothetical protein
VWVTDEPCPVVPSPKSQAYVVSAGASGAEAWNFASKGAGPPFWSAETWTVMACAMPLPLNLTESTSNRAPDEDGFLNTR